MRSYPSKGDRTITSGLTTNRQVTSRFLRCEALLQFATFNVRNVRIVIPLPTRPTTCTKKGHQCKNSTVMDRHPPS